MSKKIVVVDDDPVIRTLVSEIASSFGHQVETCDSGSACLTRLEAELPDMIILDLQMPGMTGIEVLKQLRANVRTAAVPVIMLSANSDSSELQDESGVKADRYLQKPFNVGEFIQALENPGNQS